MEVFLSSLTKGTRNSYKRGIVLFCEWYGKSINEILLERKDDCTPRPNENIIEAKQRQDRFEKILEVFHAWLGENGYPNLNTRTNYCKGMLQVFRYFNMRITLRQGTPLTQTTVKLNDFPLKPEHVKAMFHVARDLRSQLLVSLGNDLGWRISDILSIKREELPNLDAEAPIEWLRLTQKEHQAAKSCLSKTSVQLLKEYLKAFDSQINPFLFFSTSNLSQCGVTDNNTINGQLKFLAREAKVDQEAKIDLDKFPLTWQCFRKMIISTAKNLSIDPDIIKLLTGKAVNKDMLPYLRTVEVRTFFIKLQSEKTGLNTFSSSGGDESKTMQSTIRKLEDTLAYVEREGGIARTRLEQQQKRNDEQTALMLEFLKGDLEVRLQLSRRDAEYALEMAKSQVIPEGTNLTEEFKELQAKTIEMITNKLKKLNELPQEIKTIEEMKKCSAIWGEIEKSTHNSISKLSTKNIKVSTND